MFILYEGERLEVFTLMLSRWMVCVYRLLSYVEQSKLTSEKLMGKR